MDELTQADRAFVRDRPFTSIETRLLAALEEAEREITRLQGRTEVSYPKLITQPGQYEGYYWDDLVSEMSPKQQEKFYAWMEGQTLALHEGQSLVYRWDWERYQAGLPVID